MKINQLCKERMYYRGQPLPPEGEGFGGLFQDGFYINYLHGLNFICKQHIGKNTRVLELGCFNGVSSELFARYSDHVTSVDIELHTEMQNVINRTNIKFYKQDAIQFLETISYDQYDFVYIDDDHSYSHIKKEISIIYDKLKEGSYISGHDYNSRDVFGAVLDSFYYPEIQVYLDSSWLVKKDKNLILLGENDEKPK